MWLRDKNWQKILTGEAKLAKPIENHLNDENDYFEDVFAPSRQQQSDLLEEMKNRIPDFDQSVPLPDGDFSYFYQYDSKNEYPIFCRYLARNKTHQILLDGEAESKKFDFFQLAQCAHSPNHLYLAWAVDVEGSEYYTINIRALNQEASENAGIIDIDHITHSDGQIVWANDSQSIFTIWVDENHRPCQIIRHYIGSKTKDEVIFEEKDPAFYLHIEKSQSGDYLLINSHDHDSSCLYLLDLSKAHATPELVKKRQNGVEYHLAYDKPRHSFFILTNEGGAIDFKIMRAQRDTPSLWQEDIAHKKGSYILDMLLYENHLVWLVREDGHPYVMIRNLTNNHTHRYQKSDEPHDLDIRAGFEYKSTILRLHFSSMRQAEQIFDYDMAKAEQVSASERVKKAQILRKTQKLVGKYDSADYISERRFAKARDGALIPISLVYHRQHKPLKNQKPHKKPSQPLWLYGYGAYGLTIPPRFSSTRLSLLDRGWIFAIAHIRGGAAKGRDWYQKGKLQYKENSFDDFIACAQHLIQSGYVEEGFITAHGGSAGGMVMGAIANRAPHLFQSIIAQVPFVDVLATMLDADLPLTPPEWLEWGNPINDLSAYRTIARYSPYDNIKPQAYPWILATTALKDPRVGYWEAAKWVARLRDAQQGSNPICLKTEMRSGHSGLSGRFRSLDETALIYAFAIASAKQKRQAS